MDEVTAFQFARTAIAAKHQTAGLVGFRLVDHAGHAIKRRLIDQRAGESFGHQRIARGQMRQHALHALAERIPEAQQTITGLPLNFSISPLRSASLASGSATVLQGAAGLRGRLFAFGRVDAEVAIARGRQREALAAWRGAVLAAGAQVEGGFVELAARRQAYAAAGQQAGDLARAYVRAKVAFQAGEISRDDLRMAELAMQDGEDAAVTARLALARAIARFAHSNTDSAKLLAGEIIDSMFMSKKALCDFYEEQLEDARQTGVMFSLHVKATMMKVSHPIVFGHCVRIFYKEAFEKHAKLFEELGVNVNNGMANLYDKIAKLPASLREEIERDLHACHEHRPELAMVDSAKGITNFHSPSDVIVDASMPARKTPRP